MNYTFNCIFESINLDNKKKNTTFSTFVCTSKWHMFTVTVLTFLLPNNDDTLMKQLYVTSTCLYMQYLTEYVDSLYNNNWHTIND